jgi:hypothetical protein
MMNQRTSSILTVLEQTIFIITAIMICWMIIKFAVMTAGDPVVCQTVWVGTENGNYQKEVCE